MRCYSEDFIQQYYDGEVTLAQKEAFENHLKDCKVCRESLQSVKQRAEDVLTEINLLTQDIKVPDFNYPLKEKKIYKKSLLEQVLFALSAACIIAFLVLFTSRHQTNYMQDYCLYHTPEIDANQPLENQEITIHYVAPDGEVHDFYE